MTDCEPDNAITQHMIDCEPGNADTQHTIDCNQAVNQAMLLLTVTVNQAMLLRTVMGLEMILIVTDPFRLSTVAQRQPIRVEH